MTDLAAKTHMPAAIWFRFELLPFNRDFILEKCIHCLWLQNCGSFTTCLVCREHEVWKGNPLTSARVSDLPQAERSSLHLLQKCQRPDVHVGDAGAVLHPEGRAPASQRLLYSGAGLYEKVCGDTLACPLCWELGRELRDWSVQSRLQVGDEPQAWPSKELPSKGFATACFTTN